MDFHVLLSESMANGHVLRSRYVLTCLSSTFADGKQVEIGDRVVVNLRNQLGNETTSLHFHGLFQTGSNTMDGPAGVTQWLMQVSQQNHTRLLTDHVASGLRLCCCLLTSLLSFPER